MPVIVGVAIVQVCSISGGATISPKRERGRGVGIDVHRIGVLERRRPVPDHRLVDRVGRERRPAVAHRLADQRLEPVVERAIGHVLVTLPLAAAQG